MFIVDIESHVFVCMLQASCWIKHAARRGCFD